MPAQFHAIPEIARELCSEVAALDPCNPFHTFEYAEAMRSLGTQPWLLLLKEDGRVIGGCTGFLRAGRIKRSLEIPSVPWISPAEIFWAGLSGFCRQKRVSELSLDSFASARTEIPSIPGELSRRVRVEYVLPLANSDFSSGMSSNHKRNAQKAQKAGVTIERTTEVAASKDHVRLQDASMERRMDRGEAVVADAQTRTPAALVKHGAAEFFRATRDGQVLSSILVLRAGRGAYYHSAGTSQEGMSIGASHFLIRQVAETLRHEGMEKFNLGGADASTPGLERFKTGFGCQAVQLEAAQFYVGTPLQRGLGAVVSLVRRLARAHAPEAKDSGKALERPARTS
jgi:lipid II:glycine glycyltransferase (peptidoglycan interpeptide bridge formation enzyme)